LNSSERIKELHDRADLRNAIYHYIERDVRCGNQPQIPGQPSQRANDHSATRAMLATRKDKPTSIGNYRRLPGLRGWVQRMHEKRWRRSTRSLCDLTLVAAGIGGGATTRCDCAGRAKEMQHDTTVYRVKLGDQPTR
jgi:hypothetical protein